MLRILACCCVSLIWACAARQTPPANPPAVPASHINVVKAEAQRHAGADALLKMANDPDSAVTQLARRALGRIGGATATTYLLELATTTGPQRNRALEGLAMAGEAKGSDAARAAVGAPEVESKIAGVWSLGRLGDEKDLATLASALGADEPAVRAAAGLALGLFGRRQKPLNDATRAALLLALTDPDRDIRYGATYALAREHDPTENLDAIAAMTKASNDTDAEIRSVSLFGLGRRGHQDELLYQTALSDPDWRVRVQAVRAMVGKAGSPSGRDALAAWTAESWNTRKQLEGPAVHPLGEALVGLLDYAEEAPVSSLYDRLFTEAAASLDTTQTILVSQVHCIAAAGRARVGGAIGDVEGCGGSSAGWPQPERTKLIAELLKTGVGGQVSQRVEKMQTLSKHSDPRVRAAVISAGLASEDLETREVAATLAEAALQKDDQVVVVGSIADAISSDGVELGPQLRAALLGRARKDQSDPELVLTLLGALRAAGLDEARDVYQAAASHSNVTIRTAGLEALESLAGGEMAKPAPAAPLAPPATPPSDPGTVMGRKVEWRLKTTRGEVVIQLFADLAPWNVATLVKLTRAGFYSDVLFHRVVPDFVVQGGDPGGSGWGGPGYAVPAETSTEPYTRGAVGIADAGKDTGGSQFFIMHSRAPHLEGRYTLVGRVSAGMDVAESLGVGDRIESSVVTVD